MAFETAGAVVGNLKSIRVSSVGPSPFSGTPVSLPGVIAPEKFDNGGEGVGYHDTTSGNSGGAVRQTDVDIEASSENGYDVGWTADGEWLAYSVNVAAAGPYVVSLRVASPNTTGQVHLAFGANTTTTAPVPNTGDWQSWTTISLPVTLAAGPQTLKVVVDKGGFNIGMLGVATAAGVVISAPAPPPPPPAPVANVFTVAAGGNLQAAIDAAQPGDTILLQAGATFSGNFTLPVKAGSGYVTIRRPRPIRRCPGRRAGLLRLTQRSCRRSCRRTARPHWRRRPARIIIGCCRWSSWRTIRATATSSRSATVRRRRTRWPWCRTISSSTALHPR